MRKILLTLAVAVPLVAIGSVALWEFSDDGLRREGALAATTIDPVPLSWRGDWTAEARLAPGEVVSYEGAAYVAREETSGAEPRCVGKPDCPWALLAARGAPGPDGPQGPPGPVGPPGPPGSLSGYSIYTGLSVPLPGGKRTSASVSCPQGKKPTGGGFSTYQVYSQGYLLVEESKPASSNAWQVTVTNTFEDSEGFSMRVYAICANAS